MSTAYGEPVGWQPARPPLRPASVVVTWLSSAAALMLAAWVVPGASIATFGGAVATAAVIAVLNAVLPPIIAAFRLPFMLLVGFVLVLILDALMLMAADSLTGYIHVDDFWAALGVAVLASAAGVVLGVLTGANDDDEYSLRVIQRIAKRSGGRDITDAPGIVFLEIDGLALPVLRRAMRDGNAPVMARWLTEGGYRLDEWETDLSSQTGASQAGILLGSNEDIVAFRWVEKETATMIACSAPDQCAELERRHLEPGAGLLANGGASRGNLFSGGADEMILTVSRIDAEKHANPGYRAFLANGFNVMRTLVLIFWELILEWTAAARAKRRDVRPRGHRGGIYPMLRAVMCVFVRDLIVYGVLTDMMKGVPAIYATFSSYDEVAHHSGLERADTLEALRKLDQQFGRIDRARRYAARPYEIVVLSDHGQTQGATFKQRNGFGLDDLVSRNVEAAVTSVAGGDEQTAMVGNALGEATGTKPKKQSKTDVSGRDVVVLGSGNLGLVYLMEEPRRLTLEELEERHPRLLPALMSHPHIGWLLVESSAHGAVVFGPHGSHYLDQERLDGDDPLEPFSPNAPRHLLRTNRFPHAPDILVGSFYDPTLDEGCAFEELISFHGGLGGPQTRGFVLHPARLAYPAQEVIGAEALHDLLLAWRGELNGDSSPPSHDVAAASAA